MAYISFLSFSSFCGSKFTQSLAKLSENLWHSAQNLFTYTFPRRWCRNRDNDILLAHPNTIIQEKILVGFCRVVCMVPLREQPAFQMTTFKSEVLNNIFILNLFTIQFDSLNIHSILFWVFLSVSKGRNSILCMIKAAILLHCIFFEC